MAIEGGDDIEEPTRVLNRFFSILRGGITSDVFRFFSITGGSKWIGKRNKISNKK